MNGDAVAERFSELISRSDELIPLDEAALTIAQVVYPDLCVRDYLDRIDRLADNVASRLGTPNDALKILVQLNQALFVENGLKGNQKNYYDPRNSYLNDVLDRKLGIPISLAVVYLSVASRLGQPVNGVSFPGHFLVRWQLPEGQVIVDVFRGGKTLGTEDLAKLAEEFMGSTPSNPIVATRYLAPCERRQILARMLRNLEYALGQSSDGDETACYQRLSFLNLCLIADPDARGQLANRAELLYRLECHGAALDDLIHLKELMATANEDVAGIEKRIRQVRLEMPRVH